jgi:hypothetical protein
MKWLEMVPGKLPFERLRPEQGHFGLQELPKV